VSILVIFPPGPEVALSSKGIVALRGNTGLPIFYSLHQLLTCPYSYNEDEPQAPAASALAEVKSEPIVVNGASEIKHEETDGAHEEAGKGDQGEYNGEEADDDVDFHLGNGNEYGSNAPRESQGPGIKEDGWDRLIYFFLFLTIVASPHVI